MRKAVMLMNFSKKQSLAKAKTLKSPATHRINKLKVTVARLMLIFLVICGITGISGLAGAINGLMETAPNIDSINVVPDGYATRILNSKGKTVQTLVGKEANREYATLDKIPLHLQNAFVAIEDERFWTHDGIDLQGIFRATFSGLSNGGEFHQGASTLTQQLLKNQVFGGGDSGSKDRTKNTGTVSRHPAGEPIDEKTDYRILPEHNQSRSEYAWRPGGVEAVF